MHDEGTSTIDHRRLYDGRPKTKRKILDITHVIERSYTSSVEFSQRHTVFPTAILTLLSICCCAYASPLPLHSTFLPHPISFPFTKRTGTSRLLHSTFYERRSRDQIRTQSSRRLGILFPSTVYDELRFFPEVKERSTDTGGTLRYTFHLENGKEWYEL